MRSYRAVTVHCVGLAVAIMLTTGFYWTIDALFTLPVVRAWRHHSMTYADLELSYLYALALDTPATFPAPLSIRGNLPNAVGVRPSEQTSRSDDVFGQPQPLEGVRAPETLHAPWTKAFDLWRDDPLWQAPDYARPLASLVAFRLPRARILLVPEDPGTAAARIIPARVSGESAGGSVDWGTGIAQRLIGPGATGFLVAIDGPGGAVPLAGFFLRSRRGPDTLLEAVLVHFDPGNPDVSAKANADVRLVTVLTIAEAGPILGRLPPNGHYLHVKMSESQVAQVFIGVLEKTQGASQTASAALDDQAITRAGRFTEALLRCMFTSDRNDVRRHLPTSLSHPVEAREASLAASGGAWIFSPAARPTSLSFGLGSNHSAWIGQKLGGTDSWGVIQWSTVLAALYAMVLGTSWRLAARPYWPARQDEHNTALLWVVADSVQLLGFVGTVIGIAAATGAIGSILTDDPDQQREAIQKIASAMWTAFDTTFVGLVASLLMRVYLAVIRVPDHDTQSTAAPNAFRANWRRLVLVLLAFLALILLAGAAPVPQPQPQLERADAANRFLDRVDKQPELFHEYRQGSHRRSEEACLWIARFCSGRPTRGDWPLPRGLTQKQARSYDFAVEMSLGAVFAYNIGLAPIKDQDRNVPTARRDFVRFHLTDAMKALLGAGAPVFHGPYPPTNEAWTVGWWGYDGIPDSSATSFTIPCVLNALEFLDDEHRLEAIEQSLIAASVLEDLLRERPAEKDRRFEDVKVEDGVVRTPDYYRWKNEEGGKYSVARDHGVSRGHASKLCLTLLGFNSRSAGPAAQADERVAFAPADKVGDQHLPLPFLYLSQRYALEHGPRAHAAWLDSLFTAWTHDSQRGRKALGDLWPYLVWAQGDETSPLPSEELAKWEAGLGIAALCGFVARPPLIPVAQASGTEKRVYVPEPVIRPGGALVCPGFPDSPKVELWLLFAPDGRADRPEDIAWLELAGVPPVPLCLKGEVHRLRVLADTPADPITLRCELKGHPDGKPWGRDVRLRVPIVEDVSGLARSLLRSQGREIADNAPRAACQIAAIWKDDQGAVSGVSISSSVELEWR